ncbi:DUF29 family protein [Argonema antarcticum]|uniref:DUF29 family protein n=1 Tax=Argonema antarcticum TaxID=2942763 RepID=UPI0020122CD0|nr:DUF29 family protein [Argonema antarcticum]MCL1475507.1 DUF29 domain-containing protein [Argonema antarcticum A004/B2]
MGGRTTGNYLEIFSDCYLKAVRAASTETKLSAKTFPTDAPFLPEDAIDPDFIVMLVSQEEV